MDHDDMDYDEWLDWIQNPPVQDTPPLLSDAELQQFEREEEVVSKVRGMDEFITGEIILMECSKCLCPCKAEGDQGVCCLPCGHSFCYYCIRRSVSEEGKCPSCKRTASEADIIRVKLCSSGNIHDLSSAVANVCLARRKNRMIDKTPVR